MNHEDVLTVKNLDVFYHENANSIFKAKIKRQVVFHASFNVKKGEILGLVGESGCGKSSLSKAVLGINTLTEGEIVHFSKCPQMIFQDPYSSLNPAMTIGRILEEPLIIQGGTPKADRVVAVHDMLVKVGMSEKYYDRKPRELSGGQRQRISIGQALITEPSFVIADEPVSALDVTIQVQIMDLMLDLQDQMGLSYLFISHDINVIYQMCDRLMVMKNGRIIECGNTEDIFANPKNEYTRFLFEEV